MGDGLIHNRTNTRETFTGLQFSRFSPSQVTHDAARQSPRDVPALITTTYFEPNAGLAMFGATSAFKFH
jgi:hypothetical protein